MDGSYSATSDDEDSYFNVDFQSSTCSLSGSHHIFNKYVVKQAVCRPLRSWDYVEEPKLELDKKSWATILEGSQSFLVVLPTVLGFTLSQLLCQHLPLHSTRRFLLEFLLIAVPTVCNTTVTSDYNAIYCVSAAALIALLLWCSGFCARLADVASVSTFEVGKRPVVFTLLRATAYAGTSAGILAIDFKSFPVEYRKSRQFGASVMDMGIGLFVVTMGVVSHRMRNFGDMKKLPKVVLPLLLLGLARTVVIRLIDYQQDEHEYGTHLNAFFTLGLTKLLGSICSLLACSDGQLLPLSLGILLLHECILQMGLSEYVMLYNGRDGFFNSNREGLSSLPGCIGLYLLSIYFAKWYTSQDQLNFKQFCTKLWNMLLFAIIGWVLVICSAYVIGIARVTFNFGYVIWLFSICITLLLIYTFLFDLALKLTRVEPQQIDDHVASESDLTELPVFVESLNMNGLTHFMISNLLTGLVNMTLSPGKRNSVETVLILTLYMLISGSVVYILFRRGIRIA